MPRLVIRYIREKVKTEQQWFPKKSQRCQINLMPSALTPQLTSSTSGTAADTVHECIAAY